MHQLPPVNLNNQITNHINVLVQRLQNIKQRGYNSIIVAFPKLNKQFDVYSLAKQSLILATQNCKAGNITLARYHVNKAENYIVQIEDKINYPSVDNSKYFEQIYCQSDNFKRSLQTDKNKFLKSLLTSLIVVTLCVIGLANYGPKAMDFMSKSFGIQFTNPQVKPKPGTQPTKPHTKANNSPRK